MPLWYRCDTRVTSSQQVCLALHGVAERLRCGELHPRHSHYCLSLVPTLAFAICFLQGNELIKELHLPKGPEVGKQMAKQVCMRILVAYNPKHGTTTLLAAARRSTQERVFLVQGIILGVLPTPLTYPVVRVADCAFLASQFGLFSPKVAATEHREVSLFCSIVLACHTTL